MKKLRKILLLLTTSMSVLGTISILTTSCGKKSIFTNWDNFQAAASNELAINIYNVTKPVAWTGLVIASELSISNITVNDQAKTIDLDMTRTVGDDYSSTGIFTINDHNNIKYNVTNWKVKTVPTRNPSWEVFSKNALSVTANDLLNSAKKKSNFASFNWAVGTTAQMVWQVNDQAEFDIYGSASKSDPYQGMQGKPIADQNAKIITAIISIKNRQGIYDSNPIKASIIYDHSYYDLANWTFKQDRQWQSVIKYDQLANVVVEQVKNIRLKKNLPQFLASNFLSTTHNKDTQIDSYLIDHGYPNIKSWVSTHQADIRGAIYESGSTVQIGYSLRIHITITNNIDKTQPDQTHYLIFENDFMFANAISPNYGTTFNNSWSLYSAT